MFVRNLYHRFRRCVAVSLWHHRYRNYLAVFNFHQVTPTFRPGDHACGTWTSLAQFEAGMDYLMQRFKILDLEEAWKRLQRGELSGECAAITFDDGDISLAEYCVPLLERRGIPATIFLNSASFEGNGHYWFSTLNYLQSMHASASAGCVAAELDRKARLLRTTMIPEVYAVLRDEIARLGEESQVPRRQCVSPKWLTTLNEALFAIGAHGHEHERYSMMSEDWQRRDLRLNVDYLQQFKCFRPLFALPFGRKGDYNEITLQVASENRLTVWAADGGVNTSYSPVGLRIPADGRSLRAEAVHAMLGR
jgi:peptidoglycan/xylan/chitin deacetylase (PgdA/CDA1 family)